MKNWSVLVLLVLSPMGFPEEKSVQLPDKNFIMAIDALKKSFQAFTNNKDEKKDEEIIINIFKDTLCLQGFKHNSDPKVLQEAFSGLENDPVLGQKMRDIMKNEGYLLKMAAFGLEARKNPLSACSFKLDETTDEMLAKKKEKEDWIKSYNETINLKKTIHPVFVKIISDLEKQKSLLSRQRINPIELSDDIYEKNFNKVFNFEASYVEQQVLKKMALFSGVCIESITKMYKAQCAGKPRYVQVKGLVTKYLLCADDNRGKIDKQCDYKLTFIQH